MKHEINITLYLINYQLNRLIDPAESRGGLSLPSLGICSLDLWEEVRFLQPILFISSSPKLRGTSIGKKNMFSFLAIWDACWWGLGGKSLLASLEKFANTFRKTCPTQHDEGEDKTGLRSVTVISQWGLQSGRSHHFSVFVNFLALD